VFPTGVAGVARKNEYNLFFLFHTFDHSQKNQNVYRKSKWDQLSRIACSFQKNSSNASGEQNDAEKEGNAGIIMNGFIKYVYIV
jgi:hypothetical protein